MQDSTKGYKDAILTNVMLGYKQKGLIAEELLPTLSVPDITGVAYQLDEQHLTTTVNTERTGFARANRVGSDLQEVAYGPLREHAIEYGITDLVMSRYKNPLDPETIGVKVATAKIELEKELTVRDQFTTLANFPTSNRTTLSGSSQFDNAASDPIAVATTAHRAIKLGSGNTANVAVMNPDVRDALRNNAAIKARIQYAAKLTKAELDAQIADVLGVDRILVAEGVTSNQQDGVTTPGVKSYIWGDDILFAYVTEAPALETLSLGYLLRLDTEGAIKSPTGANSFVGVDKWYEQARKSTFVRANDFFLPWTVANVAGYLVKDTLSTY